MLSVDKLISRKHFTQSFWKTKFVFQVLVCNNRYLCNFTMSLAAPLEDEVANDSISMLLQWEEGAY